MCALPFGSVSELQENARTLHGLLGYHLVLNPATGELFSLELVRYLVANLHGFVSWFDLTRATSSSRQPVYLDNKMNVAHRELSHAFARIVGVNDDETINRITTSFGAGEYGCSVLIRTKIISNQLFYKDYLQASRMARMHSIYRYHERYERRHTPKFMANLQYEYALVLAIELGGKKPKRPPRHLR